MIEITAAIFLGGYFLTLYNYYANIKLRNEIKFLKNQIDDLIIQINEVKKIKEGENK